MVEGHVLNNLKEDEMGEGFNDWVKCVFKNGNNILFWHSCWMDDQPLRVTYPHLFDCITNNLCVVRDLLTFNQGGITWNLESILGADVINTSVSTAHSAMGMVIGDEFRDLNLNLQGVVSDILATDEFHWKLNTNGDFSVSSVSHLVSNAKDIAWPTSTIKLLEVIWKTTIPAKTKIFAWRFLTNRLPVKVQLGNRGVSYLTSFDCPFCNCHPESLDHIFYHCNVTKAVWNRIYLWLSNDVKLSYEEFKSFGCIQEKEKNTNSKAKLNIIWIALIWCIWNMRNTMVFDNGNFSFDEVIANILYFSWRWVSFKDFPGRMS
ncbi:uncharacterized protein LOC131639679 [Vicia villosa]|uniref:uncharacterized protein LOC131639679 n=1 Tax=Vicia villosa TaxID=3911 RepID=UPI00273CBDD8|nr:uncharacterized protein LOC131639679 [Vicia villosa]